MDGETTGGETAAAEAVMGREGKGGKKMRGCRHILHGSLTTHPPEN